MGLQVLSIIRQLAPFVKAEPPLGRGRRLTFPAAYGTFFLPTSTLEVFS